MASITKVILKSGKTSYRVFIRLRSLKPITKQFKKKSDAVAFARKIEGDYLSGFTTISTRWTFSITITLKTNSSRFIDLL